MSMLQYPETATTTTTTQLQVWNNAAFDDAAHEQPPQGKGGFSSFPMKASWSSLHSSESDCSGKENMSPAALNNSSTTSSVPSKPLLLRSTAKKKTKKSFDGDDDDRGEDEKKKKKIDDEIQEIENEIKRLSSRLETLRLQKAAAAAAATAKTAEKRGRIVPAKFMEQKQSSAVKKIIEEETTPKAAKVGVMRRGVSLGPAEILTSAGGGGGKFSRWPGKVNAVNGMITPVPTQSSRRKSCFWKLEDVSERKKKTSLSLSPKTKRNVKQAASAAAAAATVAVVSRRSVKKEDGGAVAALVQPRKLFKEGEKSAPSKKPAAKAGRVVASRYNQIAGGGGGGGDARKRSFPLENDKDDEGGKRRASLRGNIGQGSSEVRVKKRWEIPAAKIEEEKPPLVLLPPPPSSAADMSSDVLLPKIRTLRYPNESPRDSGAAKRVADLTGKRSYFCCPDEEEDMEVCHVLNFAEEDAADE